MMLREKLAAQLLEEAVRRRIELLLLSGPLPATKQSKDLVRRHVQEVIDERPAFTPEMMLKLDLGGDRQDIIEIWVPPHRIEYTAMSHEVLLLMAQDFALFAQEYLEAQSKRVAPVTAGVLDQLKHSRG
jgi:hypothetical protein